MRLPLRFRFVLLLENHVTEEQLMKVAEYSEVPITPKEFLKSDFRERCINIIPIKKE